MKKKKISVAILCAAALLTYNKMNVSNVEAANEQHSTQIGNVELQVHSLEAHSKIIDGTGFNIIKPKATNGEFIVIEATVTNTGLTQLELDSQLVYNLVTIDGAIYEPTKIVFDDFFQAEEINPGLSVSGLIAFEVPEGLSDYELQFDANGEQNIISMP